LAKSQLAIGEVAPERPPAADFSNAELPLLHCRIAVAAVSDENGATRQEQHPATTKLVAAQQKKHALDGSATFQETQ